jgi:hypothetical protein
MLLMIFLSLGSVLPLESPQTVSDDNIVHSVCKSERVYQKYKKQDQMLGIRLIVRLVREKVDVVVSIDAT